MNVCTECREAQDAWKYNTSPATHGHRAGGLRFASHASYDDTAAGMRDNRRHRYQSWVDLVNQQVRGIAEICSRQHQGEVVALPDPGGQFALFGVAS